MPTWNDFVRHPNYDEFWKKQAFAPYLNDVTVPTLNVAGWFDQEDFYGPLKIYELLEKHDTRNAELPGRRPVEPRRLARAAPADKLGRIDFDSDTGDVLTAQDVQAPFFAHS